MQVAEWAGIVLSIGMIAAGAYLSLTRKVLGVALMAGGVVIAVIGSYLLMR